MKDIAGKEITVGCIVAHAFRNGNSAYLEVKEVVGLDEGQVQVQKKDGRPGWTYPCKLLVISERDETGE